MNHNILEIDKLEVIEVYDYYDFPLLFSCKNAAAQIYIAFIADELPEYEMWLYVEVSSTRFNLIRFGEIDLFDTFTKPEMDRLIKVIVPRNNSVDFSSVEVFPSDLPNDIFPPVNDYLDIEYTPYIPQTDTGVEVFPSDLPNDIFPPVNDYLDIEYTPYIPQKGTGALDEFRTCASRKTDAKNETQARGNLSPETFEKYQRAQEDFHRGNTIFAEHRRKDASEKAIEAYSKAIDTYPDHYEAYRSRGEVYRKIGEPDKALKDYNKAIEINPDFAEAYNNRGIVYSDQGNLEQALVEYNKALERYPYLPEAYNNRGEVYRKMEEHDKALKDYNKSIELEPNEPESYIGLSTIYRDEEKYEKALENCNRAIELDTSYVTAYNNRGIIYRRMGEFEKAIKDYSMAIQLNPEYVRAYHNRGFVCNQIGRYEEAIKDYNEAIERYPDYQLAYYSRGITLLCLQEWEKAKSDLTTAKDKGWDTATAFRDDFGGIEKFARIVGVPLPMDIALLLTHKMNKKVINPGTGQSYLIKLPAPDVVRQAILELEYPADGIRVVDVTERLAEKLQISDEQKGAKNSSNLNVFRYDVVAPQFKRLLREGKLEQPDGPRTPYFLAVSDPDLPVTKFRETSSQPEWPSVERTALDPDTGEEYQITLPATHVVKQALLNFDYSPSGIHITDIAEALADQFALTEKQRAAKGKYGLVWKRHVNIAANSLVNSGQLLRTSRGWINTPEYLDMEPSDKPEWLAVERTALDPDTGEEYQITLPATRVVKQALLNFDYPPSGIRITDIAEALADQFALTEKQRAAKGKYGLVWKRHVNIAANSLVNSGQLLRTSRGWIINPEQYSKLSPSGTESSDHLYDVFISHATEDKDEIVRPLVKALTDCGLRMWYDESELCIGDSLRGKIDEGLAKSRFGIVVLSHAFFKKNWPRYELDALVALEMADKSVILPIWHKITEDEIIDHSPRLIDKIARNTSDFTIDEIAQEIAEVIQNSRGPLSKITD